MDVQEELVGAKVAGLSELLQLTTALRSSDFARACRVFADDWSENVVLQLVRHDGTRPTPLVLTYRQFQRTAPGAVLEELRGR